MTKQELKKLFTSEFLATLHKAVECCGWDVDMVESMKFCQWCYDLAEQSLPEFDVDFEMDDGQ